MDDLLAFWTVYRWGLVLAVLPLVLVIPLLWWWRRAGDRAARFFQRLTLLLVIPVYLVMMAWLLARRAIDGLSEALLLLGLVLLCIVVYRMWRWRMQLTHSLWYWARPIYMALLLSLLILLLLSGSQSSEVYAALSTQLARPNLVAHRLYPPGDPHGVGWVLSGTTELAATGSDERPVVTAGSTATSPAIWVQPSQRYDYGIEVENSITPTRQAQLQVRMLWEDAALRPLAWEDSPEALVIDCRVPLCPSTDFVYGSGMAPAAAAYLRLEIHQLAGRSYYSNIMLTTDGVRVEPFPNRQQAALAFSFDWESAMGGPIHSKGDDAHNVADATRRGLAMRQGADFLQGLFARYAISGTFYATGYDLLNGNTERRQFAGNPTYAWAKLKWGWPTDYWTTHPWYGDDPFGTVQTDPGWYFGDQTAALHAAGQEIGSHTFGHLYVRGSTPQELDADLTEWDRAAAAKGLPPVQTFAFPWQSSNSLTPAFDAVFSAHGIRSLTRLYPGDLRDHYALGAIARTVTPTLPSDVALSVMPDFLLGPSLSPDTGDAVVTDTVDSGLDEVRGTAGGTDAGKQVIDTVLARHGVTSFWNHPEQLAETPAVAQIWSDVVAYAAGKRSAGLWIAPVSTIVNYMRDMRQVEVVWRQTGGYEAIVTNHTDHTLDGVTLTFPVEMQTATVDGQPAPQVQDYQVVLPRLAAGATVTVQAAGVGH